MALLPFILLACVAGALIPVQAGVNNTLRSFLGSPVHSTIANFVVGTLASVVALFVARQPWPTLAAMREAPWWSYLGGVCGATLVFGGVVAVRELGYAGMVVCLVAGQMLTSLILDHFGVLGQSPRTIDAQRLIGVGLIVAGVVLVQFKFGTA
jgi:transporter family-2 protein